LRLSLCGGSCPNRMTFKPILMQFRNFDHAIAFNPVASLQPNLRLNAIKLRNIVGWATCFCCPPVGDGGHAKKTLCPPYERTSLGLDPSLRRDRLNGIEATPIAQIRRKTAYAWASCNFRCFAEQLNARYCIGISIQLATTKNRLPQRFYPDH